MELKDIKKVLILGAGTMGQQIGLICALHGYQVTVYDISDEILEASRKRMGKLGAWFVQINRITEQQLQETMDRLTMTADAAAAAKDADIINESVPEDPKLKGRVFAQFNELCPKHTIFTTNTSLLVPSMFAEATGRPGQFAALHFHDLRVNNIVDVMPHPGTDPAVTQLVHDFAVSIGQVPIMLHRENNGYVFNTMLSSLFRSAMSLAATDVASIEDVDRSWMGVMLMPMGPFGIMDQIGLKTVWTIVDYWAQKTNAPQDRIIADFVKQYVDRGELGAKTKKGFYTYPKPAYTQVGFLSGSIKK